MLRKEEWREIENFAQKEKADMVEKYGLDIHENFQNKITQEAFKKRKNIKKLAIMICVILIIILIIIVCANTVQMKYKLARISNLKSVYLLDFKEETVNADITGNGFFIYQIEQLPELEIHAVSKRKEETFIEDTEAKIYQYFFNKWNSPNKNKFKVEESYGRKKL